ncbi:MAG TPA: tetratricopeptide repeat protein, partial [Micromonosporaceae bacterium]|nr:tetratricopeptide repeat protein [Micromonosporaceae bacterium]
GVADAAISKDETELAADFRTYVADLRLLIVLDDARDAAQIRPLLPGTSASAVLVTSRNRLADMQGGTVFALEPLAAPEAAELFARVCGADRVAAEPAATDLVLGACAGLPLAVWIAGARLASRPGWDIGTLADQLTDERRRLDALQVGDLAVRTTFWISYSTLPVAAEPGGDVARAFRLLGLWPGADLSLSAAAALLGTRPDQAFRLLDWLVDSQLLLTPAPGRYRFHDLIRVFASEQALAGESPAERAAAIRRVMLWFLYSADHAYDLLSPGPRERVITLVPAGPDLVPATFTDYDAAADWSDVERSNLVAAVTLASRQGEHRICAQLLTVTWSSFMRSPWAGWADALRTGIDSAAAAGALDDHAWLLNYLGVVHLYGEDMAAARSVLEPALVLSRQTGDPLCEGSVTAHLAIACKELKQYDQAVAYFREAERLLHVTGSRQAARITMNLGMLLLETGRPAEAAGRIERGLTSMRDLGDVAMESLARSQLAEAYRQVGRREEALGLARAALDLSRTVRDRYQESAALLTLGLVLTDCGEYGPAREALTDARALAVALELPQAVLATDALAALDRRS